MSDEQLIAKHGVSFLKQRFHQWAESAQKLSKLKTKEREEIELARIGLDKAFLDILEFTSVDNTGRLDEIIFEIMLYTAALSKCGPKTEISNLILMSSLGVERGKQITLMAENRWVNAAKPIIGTKLAEVKNLIARDTLTTYVRDKLLDKDVDVPDWTQVRNTITKMEKDGKIIRHKPVPKKLTKTKS